MTAPVLRHTITSPARTFNRYECTSHGYVTVPPYMALDGVRQCALCQYNSVREELMTNLQVRPQTADMMHHTSSYGTETHDEPSAQNDDQSDCNDHEFQTDKPKHCPSLENLDVHYQLQPREYVIASARSEPPYLRSYMYGYSGPRSIGGRWVNLPNYQRRHVVPMITTRQRESTLIDRLMTPTASTRAKTSARRKLIDATSNKSIVRKPSALQSYMDSVKMFY